MHKQKKRAAANFIVRTSCQNRDVAMVFNIFGPAKKNREQKPVWNLALLMKTFKSTSIILIPGIVTALLAGAALSIQAATIWNGPTISFSHTDENGLQDQLTPGVALTRDSSGGGLYNAITETGAVSGTSPADTEWAIGSLNHYDTLTYSPCPLEAGNHPPGYANPPTTFVVHLINEDVYLSLTLTGWGGQGGSGDKTFSYDRSTPALAPPTPTISITNPTSGSVFAAPANVNIGANAAVSSGTVTNVQFFTNNVSFKSVLTAPFSLTANNLAAGAYALKAVATAAGISATSAVVNITVILPPTVSITNPASGAVFAAPANVSIGANAAVNVGTVTNVQFFTNGISLGSVLAAPFSLTANNLAAGAYALKAVVTVAGISATSPVVNVSVVSPVPVNISGASLNSGQFTFNYTANAGLTYGIQSSTNLFNWVSLTTNVAPGSPVLFTNALNSTGMEFFRVGRLPNP